MKQNPVPHYLNIFPTGDIPVPVCIGDLPLFDYTVPRETRTEQVMEYMRANPLAPGVILANNADFNSPALLSRSRLFERLGQRFGVELFMNKPIGELEREIGSSTFSLPGNMAINPAVKMALGRVQNHVYDPVIIEDNGNLRILDIYILLVSQSQLLANLGSTISSINNIETILSGDAPPETTLYLITESLRRVVPFHSISLVLERKDEFLALRNSPLVTFIDTPISSYSLFNSVAAFARPYSLEDVTLTPAWRNLPLREQNIRSWLGLAVMHEQKVAGILSVSRNTLSPFANNEKELALVFARYIHTLLGQMVGVYNRKRMYYKLV